MVSKKLPRRAKFKLDPGGPVILSDVDETPAEFSKQSIQQARRIGETLKAYLQAANDLLQGKYASLRESAPPHMTSECTPKAFVFPDGILVRYDREPNPKFKVLVGTPDGRTLSQFAPEISESFLHCPEDPSNYDPGNKTVTLKLFARPHDGGEETTLLEQRLYAVTPIPVALSDSSLSSNKRLPPVVSIRNEFDLRMRIDWAADSGAAPRRFLTRNRFRMPVGWEAIELYPPYRADTWNPALAPLWAENDLLASVLRRNLIDNKLREIDPNAHARKRMAKLIADFESLLEGDEEPLHQFVKSNPELLCPTHNRMWSKLPLGDRVTDFVFREPAGQYTLVELERASLALFREDGQQRAELTHAIDQVTDWRRYIEDNLRYAQQELKLEGISGNPKCLVVIGRQATLTPEMRRKLVTIQNGMPWLKLMTYDDVLSNARSTFENIVGPIWDPGPNMEVYLLQG